MADIDWAALQALAESEKFELLADGQQFVFKVEEATAKPSAKNTGLNVNLKCRVVDGPSAGSRCYGMIFIPYPGADVGAGAYGFAQQKLNAVGVPLASIAAAAASNPALRSDPSPLFVEKSFVGKVEHYPGTDGVQRQRIASYSPVPFGGSGFAPAGAASVPASNGAAAAPPQRAF